MPITGELTDHAFVVASTALHEIVEIIADELGRRPTLNELCEVLTWGARSCENDLLEGTPSLDVAIIGRAKTPRQKARPGDLVGIPSGKGSVSVLLYLGKFGRFGHAFGLFDSDYPLAVFAAKWKPAGNRPWPIFCDDRALRAGKWKLLGSRPDLLPKFRPPEMFYPVEDDLGDGTLKPYGLAEAPSGELRKLGREESRKIFADLPKAHRYCFLSESLEQYLCERRSSSRPAPRKSSSHRRR